MKKVLYLANLAVVTASVWGMNNPEQGECKYTGNMVAITNLSESNEAFVAAADNKKASVTWWSDGLKNGKDVFLKLIKEKSKKSKSRDKKIKAFNAKDLNGQNILMYATKNADREIMALLLEKNVIDINHKDNNGDSALLIAAKTGDIEKMRLLLSRGADVNAINNNGQTALSIIVSSVLKNENKEKLRLLFKYGANLDSLKNFKNINDLKTIQEEVEDERSALSRILQFVSNQNSSKRTPMSKNTLSTCIKKIKDWGEINAMITDFEEDRVKGSCSVLVGAVKRGEKKIS